MNDALQASAASLLRSSPVLGAEIDIRYRVLAVTVEPAARDHPTQPAPEDRRVQVVVHPVGTIAAALVDHGGDGRPTVLQFDEDHLSDVVGVIGETVSQVPPFPDEMIDADQLGDRLSLFGSAQTGDGTAHVLHVRLVQNPDEGDLTLDLWATFDVLELRDPAGLEL